LNVSPQNRSFIVGVTTVHSLTAGKVNAKNVMPRNQYEIL